MASEKFNLKWNDFQQNVSKTFSSLRSQSNLFDVTLVSNDHKQIQAHKLVLSACSDFFSQIFDNNSHPNPMLYFDNIDGKEMNQVLDYIYNGEVQIFQENLDKFLNVAAKLKLEGLLSTEDTSAGNNGVLKEEQSSEEASDIDRSELISYESFNSAKSRQREYKPRRKTVIDSKSYELAVNCETPESQQLEIETKFQENVVKEGQTFTCTICQKQSNHKATMRRHVETHMAGLRYDCQQCGKTFRCPTTIYRHCKETNHLSSI